jgi:mRNA-degrading endonuclease toxin of MazEF toxin-antitoxin module
MPGVSERGHLPLKPGTDSPVATPTISIPTLGPDRADRRDLSGVRGEPTHRAPCRRALIAPRTTTIRGLASEVVLDPGEDPIPGQSAVNLHSVESVSVETLTNCLGRLGDGRMREACAALAVADDCSL